MNRSWEIEKFGRWEDGISQFRNLPTSQLRIMNCVAYTNFYQ